MPPHLRRFAAALLVLFICGWVLSEAPSQGGSAQDGSLEASRDLQTTSQALVRAGRYAEALPLTRKLHEAYPTNHIYLGRLADIHEHLGQWPECATAWEAYLKVSPTPWEAFPSLGDAYLKMGRAKDALESFARWPELQPDNPEAAYFHGRAYERDRQFQKARTIYMKGLKQHPDHTDLRVGLARMTLFTGKTLEARHQAEEAVRRNPTSMDARLILGMALRSEGKLPEARRQLEQARSMSPDNLDMLQVLGGVAEQQEDLPTARAAYGHMLELDPGHVAARARLAGLQPRKQP